jgi:hypothetical protein
MGWKGFIRSASAASRRAQRETESRSRKIAKASDKLDRIEERLDHEVARDMDRVRQFEAALRERPISAGALKYEVRDSKWNFKPLSDQTGELRWSLGVSFASDSANFGTPLEFSGVKLLPTSIAVTTYGVYVAFVRQGTAKRSAKLLYRSEPARNRIYLSVDGKNFRALEGTLDSPDIDGNVIVAFPLPQSDASVGEIRISDDGAPISMQVRLSESWSSLAGRTQSIVDQFEAQANQAFAGHRKQIEQVRGKLKSNSGCSVVIGSLLVLSATAALVSGYV